MKMMILALCLLSSALSFGISEVNYRSDYDQTIFPFMKSGQTFSVKVAKDVKLSAVSYLQPVVDDLVIVITGRSETWPKYGEVFYELFQQGHSVVSYDHRGQGLSSRFLKNSQIGHIQNFSDYVKDLEILIAEIQSRFNPKRISIVAHSMGGTITSFYLAKHPNTIEKVALCAPMMGINTKPYEEHVAYILLFGLWAFFQGEGYAPGKGDYNEKLTFEENDVTHSSERFAMSRWINDVYPTAKLGGPSVNWVKQSLEASGQLKDEAKKISTPVLLFQAANDQVVTLPNQNANCSAMKNCTLFKMEGAYHELLMERDEIRTPVVEKILEFLK